MTHMPSNLATRRLPAPDRWPTRAGREQMDKGKKEKQPKAQQLLACTQRGDGELGGGGERRGSQGEEAFSGAELFPSNPKQLAWRHLSQWTAKKRTANHSKTLEALTCPFAG